jgi:hypothetical protein
MGNSSNTNPVTIQEILDRLEKLEKENEKLRKENNVLSNKASNSKTRMLTKDISNYEDAKKLFGITVRNGKIMRDDNDLHNNFSVFYQNIFRALNPKVRVYNGKETLTYTPISTLTDAEYKIYCTVLEDTIAIINSYQKELKELTSLKD